MNLCGFEVGLDNRVFLIAGQVRRAEQGPRQGMARRTRPHLAVCSEGEPNALAMLPQLRSGNASESAPQRTKQACGSKLEMSE